MYVFTDARDSDVDRDAEDINEMWLSLKKILGPGHGHVCPFVEKETDKLTKMAELERGKNGRRRAETETKPHINQSPRGIIWSAVPLPRFMQFLG